MAPNYNKTYRLIIITILETKREKVLCLWIVGKYWNLLQTQIKEVIKEGVFYRPKQLKNYTL
jgi:hypothetical protein